MSVRVRTRAAVGAGVHLERPRTDDLPRPALWLLRGGRPASRWLIRRRWQVVVHGAERVPRLGPVVVAANHIGVIDGPLLAIFSPRPVHALTKIEMFHGVVGWFLVRSGQLPLDRFRTDPRAVRRAVGVLRDGGAVGIFPEGQRGAGTLDLFHRGAAYLALVTGAPVVPLVLVGSRAAGGAMESKPAKGETIDLVYGEPFVVEPVPWPRTRETVGETSARLRAHLLAHLTDALAMLGRELPGPLPPGEGEPDPGSGVTESSA